MTLRRAKKPEQTAAALGRQVPPAGDNTAELFDRSFEKIWREFDEAFRRSLLTGVRKLGSFYRLKRSPQAMNKVMGKLFYDALEHSLEEASTFQKLLKSATAGIPETFDEMSAHFGRGVSDLHAFFLFLLFINQHPLRAVFSGRDERLPYNTISLSIAQSPGHETPTSVAYALTDVPSAGCRFRDMASFAKDDEGAPVPPVEPGEEHPRNHWGFNVIPPDEVVFVWVWHF